MNEHRKARLFRAMPHILVNAAAAVFCTYAASIMFRHAETNSSATLAGSMMILAAAICVAQILSDLLDVD